MSIFGIIITVFSLFGIQARESFEASSEKLPLQYPDFGLFDLSVNEYIGISNERSQIVKIRRPSKDELLPFNNVGVSLLDLRALITESVKISFHNNDYFDVFFRSIYDIRSSNIKALIRNGTMMQENDFNELYINSAALKILNLSPEIAVGSELSINIESYPLLSINSRTENYQFLLSRPFVIKAVINEFPLFSQPAIYYSYRAAKGFLEMYYIQDNEGLTYYDYLNNAAFDDALTNYRSLIAVDSLKSLEKLQQLVRSLNTYELATYSISSLSYEIISSINALISQISVVLLIFIGIIITSFVALLIIYILLTFNQTRKDRAVFMALGVSERRIHCAILLLKLFEFVVIYYSGYLFATLAVQITNKCMASALHFSFFVKSDTVFGLPLFSELWFPLILIGIISCCGLLVCRHETKRPLMEFLRSE
jgi:ABC-type antimicrobial peptide transport system permease subunit